jgi:hypothetical protein
LVPQLLPLRVVIFRFANIVGARVRHGVLYDFIMKLRKDPRRLEVLGDGTQLKSYLYVNVLTIAQIVKDAMGLSDTAVTVTAKPGERTWRWENRAAGVSASQSQSVWKL